MRTEHNGAYRLVEADLEIEETAVDTYCIVEGDPLSAVGALRLVDRASRAATGARVS